MKKKINKLISIAFICILFSCISSGCFNYRDINKVVFITAMLIDIDEEDNVVLYTEAFKPARASGEGTEGAGKGQRILFNGKGKTLFEAVRDATLSSSYKNNYSQNRAILFTQKAAERGLDYYTDFLDRDQELLLRDYLYVYMGDVKELMKLNLKQEEYIGVYLYNLIQITGAASRAVDVTLNEYLTKTNIGSDATVIPVVKIKDDSLTDIIELRGGAVIKGRKMVEYLARAESQSYNFLIDEVKSGTLEVTNPNHGDAFVTLEILNSKTNTKIELKDGKIKLKKDIKVSVTLGEAQKTFIMSEETRKEIEKNAENNIRKYTTKLFEDYKEKGLDIFDLKELLNRHYPNNNIEDPIKVTDIEVKATVEFEGGGSKFYKL